MKLGIIGGGVVGSANAAAFREHCEVRVHDAVPERSTHTLREVLECDLVMVCLPTPQKEGLLECDLSAVHNFCGKVGQTRTNLVLRSTVPIGTTRRLWKDACLPNLIHSPEFLSEKTALEDAANPPRCIVGCPSFPSPCGSVLFRLYQHRFPKAEILPMFSDESEALKLFDNTFGAVKVSLFNEFKSLADKLCLSWGNVLDGLLAGRRINPIYTKVPGRTGHGWNSHCWNKDTANLLDCFERAGLDAPVIRAARARNEEDRKK